MLTFHYFQLHGNTEYMSYVYSDMKLAGHEPPNSINEKLVQMLNIKGYTQISGQILQNSKPQIVQNL
jgi:hypothetical protein